jgi:hypothetical protein
MDNIALFEQYIEGKMLPYEISDFELALQKDFKLRNEFVDYLKEVGAKFMDIEDTLNLYLTKKMSRTQARVFELLVRFDKKLALAVVPNRQGVDIQEVFDRHINKQLSIQEEQELRLNLIANTPQAAEYKAYAFTVAGICREAEQDNMDFGVAMKKLTREQLREIVGERKVLNVDFSSPFGRAHGFADTSDDERVRACKRIPKEPHDFEIPDEFKPKRAELKPKRAKFKPWMWQVAAVAALVVVVFIAIFQIEKHSQYKVDDAVYAFAGEYVWQSDAKQIDINSLSDNELNDRLSEFETLYRTAKDESAIADSGYTLALAYLRLHDRDNARIVLTELVNHFDGKEDYKDYTTKCKNILKLIQ